MPNVLIREVAPETHKKLVERAASRGQSLQAYLQIELARLAAADTVEEIFARVRAMKGGRVGFDEAVRDLEEARNER